MSAGEIAPKGSASPQVMGRAPVVGGAPAQGKMDPARRRKLVRVIAMGVAGLVVLGGAGTAAFVFREKLAVLFRRAPPASTQELKAAATKSLFEDSFPSYRAGMEAAARALEPNQKDVEAAGLYLQAASYLKRRYSLSPGEWDQAVKLASRLEDENQREALKGRAGYLLATGKQAEARGLVDALANANPPDPEGAMLLAEVMLKDSDAKRAAQLLDKALQSPEIAKLAKAHHLRAEVALAAGQPQFGDAETELRKALEMDPEHVRSRVELGGALMAMGRVADAEKELKASLGEEAAKMLDATEEARAHRYLGVVYAGSRRAGDAEAEFDEAIKRDPESAANLGAYGAFRLKRREFDKAIELYKKAVAKEPGPAWVDGYARALLGAGRYVDATSQIRDAQSKDPNSAVMHYLMGRVSHGAGKADEAIKMYEKALQRDPAYAEPLIALGELALKGGDKEKAKARFSQAVEKAPSNPDAHTGMGEYLLAVDDAAGAKAAFARAVELDPDHAPARFGLGRALWALGDLKSARKELELSLQLVDRDPEVHYQYGTLLWKMGDLDAGAAAAARAVKSEPKDHRYRARLGAILFSKGDPQAAIDSLNVAASFNDKFAETYYYLGLAWSAKGDQGQAAEKMKLALELDSNNSDFHYQLGLIYENASQATDAALEFRKAIELKADHADAYEHLGNVLMVQNQYLDAVAAYDKSLDIDKKRFRVLVASADAEVAAGQPLKAIKDYLAAITADPSLAAHYKLGRAYDLTGKSEMAIQEYRLAVKNEQDNPMPHYYLGYAHKTRGANRSALAEFKEYLRLRPEAPDRKEIEDEIYYLGQK
jgi:tetratricopeptide (TPR) repeat protein